MLKKLGLTKKPSTRKRDGLLNDSQRVEADRKFIKMAVIVAVALGALNYQKLDSLEKNGRTTLIPFGTKGGDMWISGVDASNTYLRRVSELIVSCYVSVNAGSVDSKFSEILSMAHPEYASRLRDKFMTKSEDIKKYPSISYTSEIMYEKGIKVEPAAPDVLKNFKGVGNIYRLSIPIYVYTYTGDGRTPGNAATLVVFYTISQGQFSLLDIEG